MGDDAKTVMRKQKKKSEIRKDLLSIDKSLQYMRRCLNKQSKKKKYSKTIQSKEKLYDLYNKQYLDLAERSSYGNSNAGGRSGGRGGKGDNDFKTLSELR